MSRRTAPPAPDAPADPLAARVRDALAEAGPDAAWAGPVRELLEAYSGQLRLLDRVTRIADRYQAAARDKDSSTLQDYERRLKRLEKIVRISDQYQLMLHDLKQKLEHASNHDALTGLPNRRYMTRRQEEAAALAARHPQASFALLVVDIDHFKAVNDQHGHAVGDEVLQAVARVLQAPLREYDLCSRWGGEEFLLLLPATAQAGAAAMAERLRAAVAAAPPVREGVPLPTVSIGYTQHQPGESLDETLQRADKALYEAKAFGRNRVEGA